MFASGALTLPLARGFLHFVPLFDLTFCTLYDCIDPYKMVASRKSLPSVEIDEQNASQTDKRTQNALRKLQIDGTAALIGEAPPSKEPLQTYHWRGSTYVITDNTRPEWVRNQPKRYRDKSLAVEDTLCRKRSFSTDTMADDEPPAKRTRRNVPERFYGRPTKPATTAKKPRKRKATPEPELASSKLYDFAVTGGQEEVSYMEAARERAIAQGYQVEAIPKRTFASSEPLGRTVMKDVVQLAKVNSLIVRLNVKYQQSKKLVEHQREQAVHATMSPLTSRRDDRALAKSEPPAPANAQSDDQVRRARTESPRATKRPEGPQLPAAFLNEWKTNAKPNEPPPLPAPPSNESNIIDLTAVPDNDDRDSSVELITERYDSANPITPAFTRVDVRKHFPKASAFHPLPAKPFQQATTTTTAENSYKPSQPTLDLPTTAKGGQQLRWSLNQREDGGGEGRAEAEINYGRLEGESKSGRRRRIRREENLLEDWRRQQSLERGEDLPPSDKTSRRENLWGTKKPSRRYAEHRDRY